MNNLIYLKERNFFAFTINNKVKQIYKFKGSDRVSGRNKATFNIGGTFR